MTTLPYLPNPEDVKWRAGSVSGQRAQALAYVDSRALYTALDAAGVVWQTTVVSVTPSGNVVHVAASLTIDGETRTDVGTDSDAPSAFAQAIKRCGAQFGCFRGLYELPTVWQEYDPQRKRLTDQAMADLNKRYRAYFARWQQTQGQPHQESQAAHRNGVIVEEDGDILFAAPEKPSKPKSEPPVWQTWQDVDDLIGWAIDNGHALAPQHARNALRKVVDTDLGGRLSTSNWRMACELFYHNRLRRAEEKAAA